MIRAVRSEWKKVMRRWMLIGGIGLMVAFCVFAVSIRFLRAVHTTGPDVQPQANGPPRFTISSLERPTGAIDAFSGFAGNFLNVVSLVVFAQSAGSEYGWGTLRVNLSREPRRWLLLGGKLVGMSGFVGLGTFLSIVVEIVMAVVYGHARAIDMNTWWTADGWAQITGAFFRVWATCVVWGTMGALLAIAFRSAAPAIGFGIGYRLVVEPLLMFAWKDGQQWLPGPAFDAFNAGGNEIMSLARASVLLAAYTVLFLAAQFVLFIRRDVSA